MRFPGQSIRSRAARQPLVSRQAGSHRGVLSGYGPMRASDIREDMERRLAQTRAEDLVANDWAASSVVDSITVSAVGCGLQPQATLPYALLGITEDEATAIEESMEWVWARWCRECDWSGRLHFEDMQLLGLRSVLVHGELLHLAIMEKDATSLLALQIQNIHPHRLGTPPGMTGGDIRDGVELDERGRPCFYHISDPSPYMPGLHERFVRQPARVAHRQAVFHCFRPLFDEQVRGRSLLEPGMKLFRQLDDALDYELVAQIVTAAFPLFIERTMGGTPAVNNLRLGGLAGGGAGSIEPSAAPQSFKPDYGVEPGGVMFGQMGDRPHVLQSNRPGGNFNAFLELVLRAMSASTGMPYEVLTKDFSKTNYSSARAALLEAWRTILYYRDFLTRHYCQPLWAMVWEEAWLRNLLPIPPGARDFYEAQHLWTAASWMGPARGYIDPVKEVESNLAAIGGLLRTQAETHAEQGRDWRDSIRQSAREARFMQREGVTPALTTGKKTEGRDDAQDATASDQKAS